MAGEITIKGKKAKKGEKMTGGTGWRLATTKGRKRVFAATLLHTVKAEYGSLYSAFRNHRFLNHFMRATTLARSA
jgi:hypothetical protein